MITRENIGQLCQVNAVGEFYRFIDGWQGTLKEIQPSGLALLSVPDSTVDSGFKEFILPPAQLVPIP